MQGVWIYRSEQTLNLLVCKFYSVNCVAICVCVCTLFVVDLSLLVCSFVFIFVNATEKGAVAASCGLAKTFSLVRICQREVGELVWHEDFIW